MFLDKHNYGNVNRGSLHQVPFIPGFSHCNEPYETFKSVVKLLNNSYNNRNVENYVKIVVWSLNRNGQVVGRYIIL